MNVYHPNHWTMLACEDVNLIDIGIEATYS